MPGWAPARDIRQFRLLMDIDQHIPVKRVPKAGARDLPRLEDRVAVRKDDCGSPLPDMFDSVDGAWIEEIRERIVQEPIGQAQDRRLVRILQSIALQGAEIVGIAELAAQGLEMGPVARFGALAIRRAQMRAEIALEAIIVEQRVIDVEKKGDFDVDTHLWR